MSSAPTRIWYDTEFLERGPDYPISLISIGMVRESDGAQLYCVNADMPTGAIARNPWLMEHVVPHLPLVGLSRSAFQLDRADPAVKPRSLIAARVRDFVLAVPRPQLRAWYADYDHVVLCQLFGTMVDLPKGFPMWTYDLKQEVESLGNPRVPAQDGTEHHALADAKHVRAIDQWLTDRLASRMMP